MLAGTQKENSQIFNEDFYLPLYLPLCKIPVMTEGTAETPPMPPMDSSFRISGVGDGSNGDGDGRMAG